MNAAMRVLLVVQRYGADIVGGSERAARGFAQQLAARGHHVTVATSAARSYVTWDGELAPGGATDGPVRVHRFAARGPRAPRFHDLHARVLGAAALGDPLPLAAQRGWMHELGPSLVGFEAWLDERATHFDVAVLFTYQYASAWRAARVLRGRVPLVLHPTAHPELTLELAVFDELFAAVDGLAYLTPEEQALVDRRFGPAVQAAATTVCGVGLDVRPPASSAAVDAFRARHGLAADAPYLVCVGRIDRGKGTAQLASMHAALCDAGLLDAVLLVVGDRGTSDDLVRSPFVRVTGVLSDEDVTAAITGAAALVQPSPHESFSIVLCEAAGCGVPVLVTAGNDVLVGQVRRSGGGLWYRDAAEYAVMAEALCRTDGPGAALGERGRTWVAREYGWEHVIDGYEPFLERTIRAASSRRDTPSSAARR